MKIGLLLPTREAVLTESPDAGALVELAERAEEAGFDSVWAGDSLLARPRFEPLTLLAAVAARTRRVELGTAVLVAPLRNPVLLAHACATVDQVARGRLILGIGFGAKGPATRHEFAMAGTEYEHRATSMREQMEICRLLWSGEEVSYEGKFWQLEKARMLPKPFRPGGPPLWVGGSGPTAIRLTARHADGYFPNSGSPGLLRESWQAVQQGASGRKTPLLALYSSVNVGPDKPLAKRELEAFIERYYNAPYEAISKRQGCVAGSAEECAAWLAGYIEQGVEHLVLRLASNNQAEQFQRVVSELLPRLREMSA